MDIRAQLQTQTKIIRMAHTGKELLQNRREVGETAEVIGSERMAILPTPYTHLSELNVYVTCEWSREEKKQVW